jgi:TetR/AcrR family transcriptional regulator, cholesterol catabolism regulator
MGERASVKGDLSGERLLEVAAHLFRERGYLATSVRDIALAANMKAGSIYYHYPSKEALLEAVMNRAIWSLTSAVRAALDDVPPTAKFKDRLRTAIGAHLRAIHTHGDFAVASRSLDLLPKASRKEHVRLRARYALMWRKLFEDAIANGDIRSNVDVVPAQMLIIGSLNWTSEWLDTKRRSFDQLTLVLTDMVVDGLAPAAGAATRQLPRKTARRAGQ